MIARGREIWIIFSLVPLWEGKYPSYKSILRWDICQWRIQGGSTGGRCPPPSPMSLSSSRSDLLVLLNFNILLCFQPIFIQKHTKFTSKLQHFIETEHFAVRKQQKTKRPRQLGGVVSRLWEAWPKFCARAYDCAPPFLKS